VTREDLEKRSVDELREEAAARNIEGRSSMNKKDLIDALLKSYEERPPRIG
jgi:transcription termination factor Rho